MLYVLQDNVKMGDRQTDRHQTDAWRFCCYEWASVYDVMQRSPDYEFQEFGVTKKDRIV